MYCKSKNAYVYRQAAAQMPAAAPAPMPTNVQAPAPSQAALATAMQSLVDDEELHHRLAIAGKANAARFSWNETAKKTIGVYQSVMSSGR